MKVMVFVKGLIWSYWVELMSQEGKSRRSLEFFIPEVILIICVLYHRL